MNSPTLIVILDLKESYASHVATSAGEGLTSSANPRSLDPDDQYEVKEPSESSESMSIDIAE